MKKSTLLQVVSIIMIVVSAIGLVICIPAFIAAFAFMGSGTGSAILLLLLSLLGVLSAGVELFTGIIGVRAATGKGNFKLCKVVAIIALVLSALDIVFSLIGNSFQWTSLFGLVLPILYFIGIKQVTDQQ